MAKKSKTAGLLPAKIQGIPCLIDPTHVNVVQGSYSYNAPSDWDYHGYQEIEFDVYDTKGYPATWLERKMTDNDISKIEELILETAKQERDDCDY